VEQLRHLHIELNGTSYLLSYMNIAYEGHVYTAVAHHDVGYIVREDFAKLFVSEVARAHFNVVDDDNKRIYGESLSKVADYLVGMRFPTTLYRFRLQVAPKDATLLKEQATQREANKAALIASSVLILLIGVAFFLYATIKERKLNALKSDFIANVSHELKTPLSIISMFGELLSMGRTRSPEQATEYAEIIRRESVRLSRLIDSVLDFSKIERGVDVYEFAEDQNLAEIVERGLDLSRHRLERAEMQLVADLEVDLPPVRVDGNAMTVAVLNLVDNAIKYAADGKKLEVTLRRADDGVELVVRDYGPGVPDDEREAIFERFYRSRTVRLKPIRGSGIGLALVKHIAEAHGGEVRVSAGEDGSGAAFRLWIPATGEG
jgi:two-component system phosphate regulon sensor histidine kinase PhoR